MIQTPLILIGPQAAGKSSVGKLLAERLHIPFFDTDWEIEAETGVDVSWIYDVEGEAGYHAREHKVIASHLSEKGRIVLSTGGDAILSAENRELFGKYGYVIHLQVSIDAQIARTANNQLTRPMLRGPNLAETIQTLMRERQNLYEASADFTISTDDRNIHQVVQNIFKHLEDHTMI